MGAGYFGGFGKTFGSKHVLCDNINPTTYVVKLKNDYLGGPIWVYDEDGNLVRKYPLIHNDTILQALNNRANAIFLSYYEFDSLGVLIGFNHKKELADKDNMLYIIEQIVRRLDEINDGSFIVEDFETERLKSLS